MAISLVRAYSYSSGIRAVEEQKWGRETARSRYGSLQYENGAPQPKDQSHPQRLGDSNNLQGPGYSNDVPEDSWLRGGGKGGEGKPYFDKGGRR